MSSRLYQTTTPDLSDFKQICSQTTNPADYPLSSHISSNIPIYDLPSLESAGLTQTKTHLSALQDEWHKCLHTGPGVYILKGMYPAQTHSQTIEPANQAFDQIISSEKANTALQKGDHFAAGGTNDRIWNSFQKHASADPTSFSAYYSNPWLAAVSESWLGPNYRVTAQLNAVHPGGAAQDSHRDYHLGFQDVECTARVPAAMQVASQFLTLQGAVAHSDMPVESGPTRFLPYSQSYGAGFMAWRLEAFREYFLAEYVSAPLEVGDGVFFNPGLFHAAGANTMDAGTGFRRVANLLQVSSAFGKPMESVDSLVVVRGVWDSLLGMFERAGGVAGSDLDPGLWSLPQRQVRALVQAVGEGYPFPTNLDSRPPQPGGMAPESEQDVLVRGLVEGWSCEKVVGVLEGMRADSRA
ncbi:Phytanoyl-CoA dioxygenase [Penicillium nucicola]|uniref:Phytanoyl-CoA dioxygenase n=1 Tax=Penicillium nucicola TaxID=1850975 RepID=UPI002545B3CB|nr:Phytanoyl-CoA dioxygenase [Penicillium nucicola]KAJ5747642.1 Phytanoyl-CoA dioxygenase [Penicillium nucicola]